MIVTIAYDIYVKEFDELYYVKSIDIIQLNLQLNFIYIHTVTRITCI